MQPRVAAGYHEPLKTVNMTTKAQNGKCFLAIRDLFQGRYPYGLFVKFAGDHFDKDSSGDEATIILEKFSASPDSEKIEKFLFVNA